MSVGFDIMYLVNKNKWVRHLLSWHLCLRLTFFGLTFFVEFAQDWSQFWCCERWERYASFLRWINAIYFILNTVIGWNRSHSSGTGTGMFRYGNVLILLHCLFRPAACTSTEVWWTSTRTRGLALCLRSGWWCRACWSSVGKNCWNLSLNWLSSQPCSYLTWASHRNSSNA